LNSTRYGTGTKADKLAKEALAKMEKARRELESKSYATEKASKVPGLEENDREVAGKICG
jgi:hypothetical protein